MLSRRPELSQYGLTEEDRHRFDSTQRKIEGVGTVGSLLGMALLGSFVAGIYLVDDPVLRRIGVGLPPIALALLALDNILRWLARRKPWFKNFEQFNLDSADYRWRSEKKLKEHWMSLSGLQFERELAALYLRLGYDVQLTPTVGDQGIDLFLRKDNKTTIVQCKSYSQPVGPAAARELYGSLIASEADAAILACTSGFTKGVYEFVRGKPIELVSSPEIISMSERAY